MIELDPVTGDYFSAFSGFGVAVNSHQAFTNHCLGFAAAGDKTLKFEDLVQLYRFPRDQYFAHRALGRFCFVFVSVFVLICVQLSKLRFQLCYLLLLFGTFRFALAQ